MAHVLITGGTGVLGSALLPYLVNAGHTVRVMSRSARKAGYDSSIEWAQANFETGDGLAQAVQDIDTIAHLASDPFNTRQADIAGTEALLRHAREAGTGHIVFMSIAGIDRIPLAYYKAKLEVEHRIENGGVPWTILRATQFHSLMPILFLRPAIKTPLIAPVAKSFRFQLLDAREAAARIAELIEAGPSGRVPDIGGPEILTLEEIARQWQKATGSRKPLVNIPLFGKTAAGFRSGYNTGASPYGKVTWAQWLAENLQAAPFSHTAEAKQTSRG